MKVINRKQNRTASAGGTLWSAGDQQATEVGVTTVGPPRIAGTQSTTGDEDRATMALKATITAKFSKNHKIGTWNVRSMNLGKLDTIKSEMDRIGINILGVSELRWSGFGYFNSGDKKIFFSGNNTNRRNGVAIICDKQMANTVLGYHPISDRIITLRLNGIPEKTTIVQVYAPTSASSEEDIANFYNDLQQTIDKVSNSDNLMLMGDFNAKVGEEKEMDTTGKWGLGQRNERGQMLIDFCQNNNLAIANTMFEQPRRRIYTWTSPDGAHRNQIDYILIRKRWKSSVTNAKTYPGADCGSDHNLVAAIVRIRLKKAKKQATKSKFDLQCLDDNYRTDIRNRFQLLTLDSDNSNENWIKIKNTIIDSATNNVPQKKTTKTNPWLSDEARSIAEERRTAKIMKCSSEEFRKLNAKFRKQARKDKNMFLNDKCAQAENYLNRGNTKDFFRIIKEINGKFSARTGIIIDKA